MNSSTFTDSAPLYIIPFLSDCRLTASLANAFFKKIPEQTGTGILLATSPQCSYIIAQDVIPGKQWNFTSLFRIVISYMTAGHAEASFVPVSRPRENPRISLSFTDSVPAPSLHRSPDPHTFRRFPYLTLPP